MVKQTGRGERTERCQWQEKRGERVAAVKISSVRRKAAQKFWAPQQDHRPLRKCFKKCGEVKNPPVTALPCQPPLGKGAEGTGVTDCHTSDIGHWFAMTHCKECGKRADVGSELSAASGRGSEVSEWPRSKF